MSEPEQAPTFRIPDDCLKGVFADGAMLHTTPHAFMVDFMRFNPVAPPPGSRSS